MTRVFVELPSLAERNELKKLVEILEAELDRRS